MKYDENIAINLCEQSLGKKYVYKGEYKDFYGAVGSFHVVHDKNCCCPTDHVLFAFHMHEQQYYMSAQDFLVFYKASIEISDT